MQRSVPLSVLILNNVPAVYFDPLFEQIGSRSGWRLTVCYSSTWNRGVGWDEKTVEGSDAYRTVILDQKNPRLARASGASVAAAARLAKLLFTEKPDCLLCYGYTLMPQITALLLAMTTATRFAVAGDANYFNDLGRSRKYFHYEETKNTKKIREKPSCSSFLRGLNLLKAIKAGIKRWAKGAWLRLIVRRAAALISIGTANRMFWESYGAKPNQLFEARFAVDNDFFERERQRRREEAVAWRAKYGLQEKTIFLYVGRLVKRKNVDLILRAFRQLNETRAALVIVGSGEERATLETLAEGDCRVIFAGGARPDTLPLFYAVADALVLVADQEPWGLVINEAMASGLAIIAHRHCGAAIDLVREENGVVIEDFNVNEILDAMRLMVNDPSKLYSMKHKSREKIKNWSIDGAAYGIIRALEESAVPRCFVVEDSY